MRNILTNQLYLNDLTRSLSNINLKSLKGKSILITGGLGLIGSSVIDILYTYNKLSFSNVVILVAATDEFKFNERYGNCDNIRFVGYNALESLDFNFKVDYIIHCASPSSPDLYVTKPVDTMLANIIGIKNLLEYAKRSNVIRLLYISSSEVYGVKSSSTPFEEDSFGVVNINLVRSSYSESKRASELLCKSYYIQFGVETIIVRPGHIFGPTASLKDNRISSAFAFLAAQGKNLVMKSDGLQKRSYCYSVDCGIAILTALLNGKPGEAYNIGHSEVTTIKQMVESLAKIGDVKVIYPNKHLIDSSFNPMNNSTLNDDKIKTLGYKESFSVEEGLFHTVRIIKETLL